MWLVGVSSWLLHWYRAVEEAVSVGNTVDSLTCPDPPVNLHDITFPDSDLKLKVCLLTAPNSLNSTILCPADTPGGPVCHWTIGLCCVGVHWGYSDTEKEL